MKRTTRKTTTLGAATVGLGILSATALAGIALPAQQGATGPAFSEPAEPMATEMIRGEITEISQNGDFVIKDSANETHSIKTNEKTAYTLDGKEAVREQVVFRSAEVQAKLNADGLAVSVNRDSK